jgi:Fe(3+) dicitrate transport protein
MAKRRIASLLFSLLILSGLTLRAQETGSISGSVSQKDRETPLAGVTLELEHTRLGAISNGRGQFLIPQVPAGDYLLHLSLPGYLKVQQAVSVRAGASTEVRFELEENVMALPSVVIEAVTLTGGNVGLKDIPGSAHYLSPIEIQKYNYTDLHRTLRSVPGVNVQEEDGWGLRPNIGLRGTGVERSSKISIMEDGVLMAPAPYAAPAAYFFPTIGRMQAVEVLKGASQIQYGPYTTGGAINLISTQIPTEFSGRLHLMAGSFGARNLHAYVGNSHKNVAYLVETFQFRADGFKELDNDGNTGFDKTDYLAKLRINTGPNAKVYQSLTFKIGQTLETSDETYLGLTEADFAQNPLRRYAGSQQDVMETTQQQYSVRHTAQFSQHVDLTTTVYRSDFKRNWYKLDQVKDGNGNRVSIANLLDDPTQHADAYAILAGSSSPNDDALEVKANNREYYAQGVQSTLGLHFGKEKLRHDLEIGLRLHEDQIDRFQWVDLFRMQAGTMMLTSAGTPGTESNRIETAKAFAGYLQYRLKIGRLSLTPGLRYERVNVERQDYGRSDPERTGTSLSERSNLTTAWIPGMGIDYKFNPEVSVFAGVHKGFAPPGSQPETQPESSINYEAGLRYDRNGVSGQAVLFLNDYSNLLGADLAAAGGGGTNDQYNGGEAQSAGLEFQLGYDLLTGQASRFRLPVSLVYTYTDATFRSDFDSEFEGWGSVKAGYQLPYLANHQLAASIRLEHTRFDLNLSAKFVDEMRTVAGIGAIPDNQKTDQQLIVDMSGSYALHRYVDLFSTATNLTNQVYVVARRPSGLRPGMPRAFNLGIKANF